MNTAQTKIEKLNLKSYLWHFFLCTGPNCCSTETGQKIWDYLKKQLDANGLSNIESAPVYRTKANCLRICQNGPIAVVYPSGTWYANLNEQAIDEIITSHLIGGKPVKKYILCENKITTEGITE